MSSRIKLLIFAVVLVVTGLASPLLGQQKGQWVPGQFGLNAGVIPDPGITYANLAVNYSAGQLNNANGNPIKPISGTYSFWADENVIYYVPNHKFLGGYYMPYVAVNYASGDLVADITDLPGANLGAGGSGLADTYVQPVNMGWHFGHRVDFNAGYSFTAPTGRFSPGASDNVGSGYWGNDITSGTTYYITKNKGTSANLATAWEIHQQKSGTHETPGQTFTMEWGFGQVLPIKKDMSMLAQLGLVGYDQWQVSRNGGTVTLPPPVGDVPASILPYYSSHGVGVQANIILPAKNLVGFFKYYDQYRALATVEGRTFVFGFSYTLKIPKTPAPKS
jgi:hypothetical protein